MAEEKYVPNEEDIIVIPDEDGNEERFEIIMEFDVEARNAKYMLLVPVDTDDAELEEEVIAFRYEESEEGELTLFPIDDEEEWKIVEDTFQTLMAEGEE
ncbi:MAG: hypothetical protein RLZZ267_455 [Bacillota bacterium]|jgi:uncharacterized protein YrzB (UPF0473 family)